MNSIDDLRSLLKKKEKITYPDLLEILLMLERESAITRVKIKAGLTAEPKKDMKFVWASNRLADRIRIKIEKKLNK